MRIVIASGKGGTGKTTVATNLALSLDNVQLLDCDVEEPNAGLFLEVEPEHIEEVYIKIPVIDEDKCTYCGDCAQFCQYNALAIIKDKALIFTELCHGCGGCTLVCPENAITEENRSIGKIEGIKLTSGTELLQGLLNVGEPLSTPVIKALKQHIDPEKTVILDSPPGTACPVIESLEGADYCILVTEPTPFGLHDLKLAVDVVRTMGIPFGVVINRDGVGDDGVKMFCSDEDIPVILTIPQDQKIARLYSVGIPFVKEMPEWKARFVKLFEYISKEVAK